MVLISLNIMYIMIVMILLIIMNRVCSAWVLGFRQPQIITVRIG